MLSYLVSTVAYLTGDVDEQQVKKITNNANIKLLIIDSHGGYLQHGLAISKFVHDNKIDCLALTAQYTAFRVFQNCHRRILKKTKFTQKQLMFHAPHIINENSKINLCDNHKIVMTIEPIRKRMNMSQDIFYDKIKTDWFVTEKDLLQYNIVDHYSTHTFIDKFTFETS